MSKFSNLFAAQDMTEGTPWKKIVAFAIPLLIGNIAQQLYNTADSVIVGKYVGDNALAAVGGCGPTLNLLIVLFVGIATGAGIMVARYFGARNKEALSHSVGTCMTLTLLASLLTGVLTDAVIAEISVTGSLMIIGITLNVLGVTKLRILNMTPALLLPVLLCKFM